MSYVFTDYNRMVGKRPRQIYWKELQDEVLALKDQMSRLSDGPSETGYREATDPIRRYFKGSSTFAVDETVSTGYPALNGVVETVYINVFQNIQHFFEQTEDGRVGDTYHRQWKEHLNDWSPWEKVLTERDLREHIEDRSAHLTEIDRYRLEGYVHNQAAFSKEWKIPHHLNKYPSVTVTDSAGTVVIGDVRYDSENEVTITFAEDFSGMAYLS